jgi:hypothetical protein
MLAFREVESMQLIPGISIDNRQGATGMMM